MCVSEHVRIDPAPCSARLFVSAAVLKGGCSDHGCGSTPESSAEHHHHTDPGARCAGSAQARRKSSASTPATEPPQCNGTR